MMPTLGGGNGVPKKQMKYGKLHEFYTIDQSPNADKGEEGVQNSKNLAEVI